MLRMLALGTARHLEIGSRLHIYSFLVWSHPEEILSLVFWTHRQLLFTSAFRQGINYI